MECNPKVRRGIGLDYLVSPHQPPPPVRPEEEDRVIECFLRELSPKLELEGPQPSEVPLTNLAFQKPIGQIALLQWRKIALRNDGSTSPKKERRGEVAASRQRTCELKKGVADSQDRLRALWEIQRQLHKTRRSCLFRSNQKSVLRREEVNRGCFLLGRLFVVGTLCILLGQSITFSSGFALLTVSEG